MKARVDAGRIMIETLNAGPIPKPGLAYLGSWVVGVLLESGELETHTRSPDDSLYSLPEVKAFIEEAVALGPYAIVLES